MLIYENQIFNLKWLKIIKIIISSLVIWWQPTSGYNQEVRNLYEKIAANFAQKNYYTSLNLCRDVIRICENSPEAECWYTNIMKDIYRYKGLAEFEIYKEELKKKRLDDAIESLTVSYNLFRDPAIQFLRGYLKALEAILSKSKTDLNGLVIAWESLLNLYAQNGWEISADIIDRIKLFIRVAEKFSEPVPKKNYTGVFAKFIIVMACDLAERGNIPGSDKEYFSQIRLKYYIHDRIQWQKWRGNVNHPE